MSNLTSISNTLRTRARQLRVSQATIVNEGGVARQTVTNIFGGDQDYRMTSLLAVADRLGLSVVLVPKGSETGLSVELAAHAVVKTGVQASIEAMTSRVNHLKAEK